MDKYIIIVSTSDNEVIQELNDYVCVSSLFGEGESITGCTLHPGFNRVKDMRIVNAAARYAETNEDVEVFNLTNFVFEETEVDMETRKRLPSVYHNVHIEDGSITVDGFTMPIRYKSGFTYRLLKSCVQTDDVEHFARFMQETVFYCNAKNIIKHVMQYGK